MSLRASESACEMYVYGSTVTACVNCQMVWGRSRGGGGHGVCACIVPVIVKFLISQAGEQVMRHTVVPSACCAAAPYSQQCPPSRACFSLPYFGHGDEFLLF